jgi:hypothetical protein
MDRDDFLRAPFIHPLKYISHDFSSLPLDWASQAARGYNLCGRSL